MVSTGLMLALFVVPLAIIFMMRKGIGGSNSGIPAVRSTPNCDASTHFCTCPNGESWQMGPASTCEQCTNECYNRMGSIAGLDMAVPDVEEYDVPGFDPQGGATGAKPFPSNMLQGTIQFPLSEKVAIPIVEEGIDLHDAEFMENFAHGACQCDDYECCYTAPYQSRRGDIRTERSCEAIFYGDQVQACDNAFLNWQDDMAYTGIDSNNYINHKINDKRFFYDLGPHGRHNRHRGSGRYRPSEYAYMATGAHRPYNQRAYPAKLRNNIRGQTKSALYRILREKTAAKNLKYARMSRKLL